MLVSDRIRVDFLATFSNRSSNGLKSWTDAPFRSSMLQKTKSWPRSNKWIQNCEMVSVEHRSLLFHQNTTQSTESSWNAPIHVEFAHIQQISLLLNDFTSQNSFGAHLLRIRTVGKFNSFCYPHTILAQDGKMTIFFDKNIFDFGDLPSLAGR